MSNCLFIHGDARRLPIDPKSIDAIVSDPPWGIDADTDYTRFVNSLSDNRNHGPRIKHDDQPFDPKPWLKFQAVALWGANCFSDRLPMGQWLVWLKKRDSQIGTFMSDAELCWTNKKRTPRRAPGVYCFEHVWHGFDRPAEVATVLHPTQKPIAVMRWCIRKLGLKPNSLICDPYCGSGSTAIAAEQEGHRFIGLDLDRDYLKIAKHRIDHPNRHIPRPGRPENHPLFARLGDEAPEAI